MLLLFVLMRGPDTVEATSTGLCAGCKYALDPSSEPECASDWLTNSDIYLRSLDHSDVSEQTRSNEIVTAQRCRSYFDAAYQLLGKADSRTIRIQVSRPYTMNPLRPTLGLASSLKTLRFPTRQFGQLKPYHTTQFARSTPIASWSRRLTAVGLGSAAGLGLFALSPGSSKFSPIRVAECECKRQVAYTSVGRA